MSNMKYFEITAESPAYEPLLNYYDLQEKFVKADDDIKKLIGCDTVNNLWLTPDRLFLRKVPSELKDQFCQGESNGFYLAKVKSEINKAYKEIMDKHGIKRVTIKDIELALGTAWHSGLEGYRRIDGKYYIETNRIIENMQGLIEVSEPDYLRLKADWLEKKGA